MHRSVKRQVVKGTLKRAYGALQRAYGRHLVRRDGFWFVDIPRTSSSSIRVELAKRFGMAHGKGNLMDGQHAGVHLFPSHQPAREMAILLGVSLWERIFTFTVVRNPWDRVVSIYHYRRKVGSIPRSLCFRDYVLALRDASVQVRLFRYHGYRYGAADYVLGGDGEMLVDYVVRYEQRTEGLQYVAARLHFPELGALAIQGASPGRRHYSAYYDAETRAIVASLYKRDADLFGYRFEGPG